MARCEEWANFKEVPRLDVGEDAKKRRVREFVASWFLERCLAKDEQETSIDFGKRLSCEFMMRRTEKVDKGKLIAVEALEGERKRFSGAAAAAPGTAIGKIQTGKMDEAKHAAVKASGGDKRRFSIVPKGAPVETGKAIDKIRTEKMDKTVVAPVDTDTEKLSFITGMAKLLNRSEDWIEKRRQQYKENAARSKRINEEFLQLCVEAFNQDEEDDDEEDDDDYDANYARVQELNTRLWNEHCERCKLSGLPYEVNCREEDNMMALA